MGCGRSKLNHSGEIVPRKIRIYMIRKFKAIIQKQKLQPLKIQTPSTKKLLKYDIENKSVHSQGDSSLISVNVAPSLTINDDIEWYDVIWDIESETETENESFEEEMMENVVFHEAITDTVRQDGNVTDLVTDTGSGERVMTSFDDSFLLPGSPSFRIYCVGVTDSDDEEGKNGEIVAKEDYETSENMRIDDRLDESAKSENSQEEYSCIETEKKTRKRKGFKRILLPTKKPVMNLFRVKSCYIPSCAGKANAVRTTS